LVGRYYDPITDQFLSVDPDVAETGQPYAFTGDDPLNATDPLGLKGWYCIKGKTHYYKGNKYGKVGNGKCVSSGKGGPDSSGVLIKPHTKVPASDVPLFPSWSAENKADAAADAAAQQAAAHPWESDTNCGTDPCQWDKNGNEIARPYTGVSVSQILLDLSTATDDVVNCAVFGSAGAALGTAVEPGGLTVAGAIGGCAAGIRFGDDIPPNMPGSSG
jgi:hypothetical protein